MQSLPTPSDSPPGSASANSSSRKRQRSHSMESEPDTSSSATKRTLSESPAPTIRSPQTENATSHTFSEVSATADSYRAGQEANHTDTLMLPPSSQPSAPSPTHSTSTSIGEWSELGGLEKLRKVESLQATHMEKGQTWYLVSATWWNRWKRACKGEIDKEGPVEEKDLGPVDNIPLVDQYTVLKPGLVEDVEVIYVIDRVWELLVEWYGEPDIGLPREVIELGLSKRATLELSPPRLRVLRMTKGSPLPMDSPSHPYVILSGRDTTATMCKRLADAVADPSAIPPPEYRIWNVTPAGDDFNHTEFPASELATCTPVLITPNEEAIEDESISTNDAFVVEFRNPNGSWIVNGEDHTVLTDEPPKPLFPSSDSFFNRIGDSASKENRAVLHKPTPTKPSAGLRSNLRITEPGTLGLGNMGNTCFMNSALQCLAHNQELTEYFSSGVYEEELNPDNPLGMQGAIAEAYGALIDKIWVNPGSSTSFSPREFKSALQKFAPQFHGYQQHDSQELVAFLLDGLHEDLNRVKKKPYVENPDWEGGGDLEMAQLAQKSWEGYMKRNDSVIVDLFQGQYQSTLVCPECQKVSITFDPFMYLTLPLPVVKKWRHRVHYVPWDVTIPHKLVEVEISRDSTFKDLKVLLGKWMESDPNNLLMLEVFNHRFYKSLDEGVLVSDMMDNDILVCYEMPCNAQQSRNYKRQPDEPLLLPIYLVDAAAPTRYTYANRNTPFGYPTVMPFTKEQLESTDAIYAAIVHMLTRWTANSEHLFHLQADEEGVAEIPINTAPMEEAITEITEDGEVTKVQDPANQNEGQQASVTSVGPKAGIFTMKIALNHERFGIGANGINRFATWEQRRSEDEGSEPPVLLQDGDALYLEFDEHMKAYYFGDTDVAHWDHWEKVIHPDLEASQKAEAGKKKLGLSLQDCLDEFTKEEKLGADDLWYCPRCKKHQQATKKFDLWKVPDVLVVHLKRFSNSRMLRDKIDAFIDFPVEGLDLTSMVGQRAVANRLKEKGTSLDELGLEKLEEPLVYDLFAVDEHMGGLGGGHYRAYAKHHVTSQWYHFDDSFASPVNGTNAVNANAYLLFYRRRSDSPLGGKSHLKTQEAKARPKTTGSHADVEDTPIPRLVPPTQLPTPPNDNSQEEDLYSIPPSKWTPIGRIPTPPLEDDLNVRADDVQSSMITHDILSDPRLNRMYSANSGRASPSSSIEVEHDPDDRGEEGSQYWGTFSKGQSPEESLSGRTSPTDPIQDESDFEFIKDQDDQLPQHRDYTQIP